MTIPVAHDFTCPWCWIAFNQAARLHEEFGVNFDWLGYELWPIGLEHPESAPAVVNPDRPRIPTRLELAYYASDVSKPRYTPLNDDIHNALEAVEHAKKVGKGQELVDRLYRAQWMEGRSINELDELERLASGIVPDTGLMLADIKNLAGDGNIVKFDEGAYAKGVWNVPTFFVAGKKYAEQPYPVLARAVRAALK